MTQKLASTEQVTALNHRLGLIEQQVSQVHKLASAKLSTETAFKSLREMVAGLHFYAPGDQAKNDAWYTPGGKVDTVEDHPTYPADVTHPKTANVDGAGAAVLAENAAIGEGILTKLAETNEKIETLVTAGRRFNASQAKLDLHKIATATHTVLAEMDLAMPYVKTDLVKLAAQADQIHSLFASAKV